MLTVITPHNSSISAKKISQIKTGGFIILNISFPNLILIIHQNSKLRLGILRLNMV